MRIRQRKPPLLLIVVAILILLLPLLAYLQYDWLGKVSEREREQMQTALRRTLGQFTRDFDREIARIFIQFQSPPDRFDQLPDECAKVYAHWKSTAPYPKLIRDIFLDKRSNNTGRELLRLDTSSRTWTPWDWTTEFGPRRDLNEPVDGRIPALVIPLIYPPTGPGPNLLLPEAMDRVILRLNLEYIQQEFVPALVHSHFQDATADYRLEISSRGEGSRLIYSSAPGAPIGGTGDAVESILRLRFDEFRSLAPLEVGGAQISTAGVRGDRVFSYQVVRGFTAALPSEGAIGFGLHPSTWTIEAVHRAGSLDAAVSRLRRQNLFVSFSILALLAASIAIVLASTARAHRLVRQQMEFVSTVSHELRTPLAVICSAGENLADGVVRDSMQLRSYGETVRNEGRRLTEMVEQVLSFAGIQSGLKKHAFAPVDLADVTERALSAFEIPIRENAFTVERQIPECLPPVMGDASSLTRAVQNLISNAIKYGALSRWIGVSILTEGSWVKLAVLDRGPGISSSDMPHIFDPFYRGRSAIDAQIQGSGLGLSLVKQAVESHGGHVEVQSDPGRGSSFCIKLPVTAQGQMQA
jgi:signal transduction histidine kinase